MIQHRDSHVDHGLNKVQICHLLERFTDRKAFFLETFELPKELGTVPCALWGPLMGDLAISENEVVYALRGPRTWTSRLVARPMRSTRLITVIAGPHEELCSRCHGNSADRSLRCPEDRCREGQLYHACVLYTAFGGPQAPQEPKDPGCKDPVTSAAFWRDHALTK